MLNEIKMTMSLVTSGVTTKLQNLKSAIGKFATAGMQKLNMLAKAVSTGLVVAFSAAARSALAYGKEIGTLSKLAGTNIEEFQKLAYGAKTVGVESDKLADIYKDVQDKVGDFLETGGGPMVDYFENIAPLIGQQKEDFKDLSGPEALQKYVDGLEKAGVSGETMTFYMEAIASDSTKLLPLLADGGRAFTQLGVDAVNGGAVMSQATADNLKKAQDRIDKFKLQAVIKVGELIGGAGDGAALKKLGAQFMEMMAKVGGWLTNAFLGSAQILTQTLVAAVVVVGDKLKQGFQAAGLVLMQAVAPAVNSIIDAWNLLTGGKLKGIDVSKVTADLNSVLYDQQRTFTEVFDSVGSAFGDWTIDVSEQLDFWKKIAAEQGIILKNAEDVARFRKEQSEDAGTGAGYESQISREKQLQLELAEAQASGDYDAIQTAKENIALEKEVSDMVKKTGVGREKALDLINKANAQRGKMKGIEAAILQARIDGDYKTERALTLQVELHEEALRLMEELGTSYTGAYQTALEIAQLEWGPDLDNSGNVTKWEQDRYDARQKLIKEMQKEDAHNEKMKDFHTNNMIPNAKERVAAQEKFNRKLTTAEDVNKRVEKAASRVLGVAVDTTSELGRSNAQANQLKKTLNGIAAGQPVTLKVQAEVGSFADSLKPLLQTQITHLASIDASLKC